MEALSPDQTVKILMCFTLAAPGDNYFLASSLQDNHKFYFCIKYIRLIATDRSHELVLRRPTFWMV